MRQAARPSTRSIARRAARSPPRRASSDIRGPIAAPEPVAASAAGAVEERFILPNPEGLHARPASLIVTALGGLDAKVTVRTGDKKPVDGRSPIGLMALGARQGDEIVVAATGVQAAEALAAVRNLIATSFGE